MVSCFCAACLSEEYGGWGLFDCEMKIEEVKNFEVKINVFLVGCYYFREDIGLFSRGSGTEVIIIKERSFINF